MDTNENSVVDLQDALQRVEDIGSYVRNSPNVENITAMLDDLEQDLLDAVYGS